MLGLIKKFCVILVLLCACSDKNIDLEGPPAPDLTAWLNSNANIKTALKLESANIGPSYKGNGTLVEVSYDDWTSEDKEALNQAYQRAWINLFVRRDLNALGADEFVMPLACLNCAADNASDSTDYPLHYVDGTIGKKVYFAYAAHSLAIEIGAVLPWSTLSSSESELVNYYNSRSLLHRRGLGTQDFLAGNGPGGAVSSDRAMGSGSPATPIYAYNFLLKNSLIGSTHEATIHNLLHWFRLNVIHFYGAYSYLEATNHWGFAGEVPAHRLMDGTIRATEVATNHWTAGCHGTNSFLKSVLKTVNIPVEMLLICGHNVAYFPTIDRYMDHGDNPYNSNVSGQPAKSISGILIDSATFVARFGVSPHGTAGGSPSCAFIGQAAQDF